MVEDQRHFQRVLQQTREVMKKAWISLVAVKKWKVIGNSVYLESRASRISYKIISKHEREESAQR